MKDHNTKVHTILRDFEQLIKNPECLLEGNNSLRGKITDSLKQIYDTTKSEEINSGYNGLPELIIKNFDVEQIWQQIELQNGSIVSNSISNVSKLIASKNSLLFTNIEDEVHIAKNIEYNENESVKDFSDDYNEIANDGNTSRSETEFTEQDLRVDSPDEENVKPQQFNRKMSAVDDEFFKLHEMENFQSVQEKNTQNEDFGNNSDESVSEVEDNVNLFESFSDDDKMKTAKFKDFFVERNDGKKSKAKNILDIDDSHQDEIENESIIKSSLELRKERLQETIKYIEQENINEKPWQLKGEITADKRPQNSLLEEIVEFDLTTRPAPIITEQTTLQLEDIIKQRIKDNTFDNVVRKVKPVETSAEFKRRLVLDQEKSKQSLAQIYEKEFLEQEASLNPENNNKDVEPELHKLIKSLMTNLFYKLDSLSNFHFTPKPAIPELKIVNNLPSISMEEVAPVAASDGALLAPEEIKNKNKGTFIGKTERTTTDKNRERRKKKQKQRIHMKEKQKPGKLHVVQQLTKKRNVDKMDESVSNEGTKSSKAFFTKLQEEMEIHISNKVKRKGTKREKPNLNAKKIKL